jgi:3-dehydroquinate synthetase
LFVPASAFSTLISFIKQDKKNASGKILMALPQGIGQVNVQVPVSEKEILRALNWYTAGE